METKPKSAEITKTETPAFLTQGQLAAKLGTTTRTIQMMQKDRRIPVIRMGRRAVRYDWNAVQAALAKFTQNAIVATEKGGQI